MEDMRMVKFETLVRDITVLVRGNDFGANIREKAADLGIPFINDDMLLIFDYDKLNIYGKKIMETSIIYCEALSEIKNAISCSKTEKDKIEWAKGRIKFFRSFEADGSDILSYHFIFWALLILAVDKTDYEEKLSLICDFAKILHISDEKMLDIVQVIKYIFREETNPEFVSERVPEIFEDVLKMYE